MIVTNKIRETMRYLPYFLALTVLLIAQNAAAKFNSDATTTESSLSIDCVGAGTITSSSGPIACANSPLTLTISGHSNVIIGWMVSTDFGFSDLLTSTTISNANTLTLPNGITANTYVKVLFLPTNTAVCPSLESSTLSISVNTPISNNVINSNVNSINCTSNENIIISGPTIPSTAGNVFYVWQMSTNAQNWTVVASGANSSTLTMVQYPTQSVYFRRIINTASCGSYTSNTIFIEFVPSSVGGNLEGGGNFCSGQENITLSLSGFIGEIVQWESSSDGVEYVSIGNAGQSSLTINNLIATTYYRVAVEQDGCGLVYSNTQILNIGQPIENNVIYGNQIICYIEIPEPIVGSEAVGGTAGVSLSILWQYQEEGSSTWENIPVGSIINETLYFTEPLLVTTHFRRIISDEDCDFSVSDIVTIEVVSEVETTTLVDLCQGETYLFNDGTSTNQPGTYTFPLTSVLTGCDSISIIIIESIPVNGGTFSDSGQQQVCIGSNSSEITLNGYEGTIESWYYSNNINGPYVSLFNSSNSIQITNILNNTYLKAFIFTSNCGTVWSPMYTISVYNAISNNNISADQSICPGYLPELVSGSIPAGGNGNYSFQWQYSYDETSWDDVTAGGNSLNYALSSLTQTTYLRRLVFSGSCQESISNVITIELVQPPSGFITTNNTGCPGEENEITFNLTGTPPFEVYYSDGSEFFTLDNINTNVFSISLIAENEMTYTFLGLSDANCTAENFEPSSVNIDVLPEIPEVNAGMDAFVCGLSHTVIGSDPADEALNSHWSDLQGNLLENGTILTTNVESSGVYGYIYTVSNDVCGLSIADTVWITYDLPVVSNAGPNQVICENSTQLQANSLEFGQGFWIIPASLSVSNPFDPTATVSNLQAGETYNLYWVADSEYGVCNSDTSLVTITVQETSVAGILSSEMLSICEGFTASVSADGFTGDILGWIITNEFSSETIYTSSSVFETSSLNQNTGFQIIVQSGTCAPDTSDVLLIEVNPTTFAGNLNSDQTFCSTENSGQIQLTGAVGEVLWWESSQDDFESFSQINSTLTEYNFENIESTTQFRVKVQSGDCPSQYSNIATIEIGNLIDLSFEISPNFCSTDDPIELNSLLSNAQNAEWTINGNSETTFDPSSYSGEVNLYVSHGEESCFSENSETIFVFTTPNASAGLDQNICGTEVTLNAELSSGIGQWTANEEILFLGEDTNPNLSILSLAYGPQNLTWTESNGQCSSSDTVEITFWEAATPADAGPDQHLSYTSSTLIKAENPQIGFGYWSAENPAITFENADSAETYVKNLEIGENKLFWNVSNGNCELEKSELIVFVNPLLIPNGFTPNGDNINDLFVIEGIEMVSPVNLTIVNRWGEKVYENTDYNNLWSGLHKNGNELPSDTYYYSLSAFGIQNSLSGFIVLKR